MPGLADRLGSARSASTTITRGLTNRISTTPQNVQPPTLFEEFKDDHVAFIGEGSVDVVADILPSLSIRAGYEVLFLNELVLAGDNFNQTSPYGNQGTRVPFVEYQRRIVLSRWTRRYRIHLVKRFEQATN